jgi:tetratricopeptide (TPR) repeat protein
MYQPTKIIISLRVGKIQLFFVLFFLIVKRVYRKRINEKDRILKNLKILLIYFACLFLGFFASCSREKSISEAAFKSERMGRLTEAVYGYKRALDINSEYGFANKRLGFILSESQDSLIPAIFYLEKARKTDMEDKEVGLKLIDLTLFLRDYPKAEKLRKEMIGKTTTGFPEYVTILSSCIRGDRDRKKIILQMEAISEMEEYKFIYRSISICYELANMHDKAIGIVTKYRNYKNE